MAHVCQWVLRTTESSELSTFKTVDSKMARPPASSNLDTLRHWMPQHLGQHMCFTESAPPQNQLLLVPDTYSPSTARSKSSQSTE